jgi:uncharacterized protein
MANAMYDAAVPVFNQMLGSLSTLLDKANAHAQAKKFDVSVLLQSRLAPDMLPFVRQVQIACDSAKFGVARLTGVEAPKFPDDEATVDELKDRIARTLEFINGVSKERFEGTAERAVEVPLRDRKLNFDGRSFLLHWSLPNFYFHLTTAYNLLRHNGVEIGKKDFIGPVG